MVLSLIVFAILVTSLAMTWYIGRRQKSVEGSIDSKLAKPIQEHVYIKNPIFASYGIFFVLLLVIVAVVAIMFFK